MKYPCPVCGYEMDDPPRDYNICPSCGTEFGYHDSGRTYEQLRRIWLSAGAKWWSPVDKPPPKWNPHAQLLQAWSAVKTIDTSTNSGISPSNAILVTSEVLQPEDPILTFGYRVRGTEAA